VDEAYSVGLRHDDRQRVCENVVQLPGDPVALVFNGDLRGGFAQPSSAMADAGAARSLRCVIVLKMPSPSAGYHRPEAHSGLVPTKG
jgi:hypothetical protein